MTQAANLAALGSSGVSLGMKNRIINGDMRIDQRNAGAAITVTAGPGTAFAVDRFFINRANGYANNATAQQVSDAPLGFTKSLKYTSGTAETITSGMYSNIQQFIEGYNIADLGWGFPGAIGATLSFWVKVSTTGTFAVVLRSADASLSYATTFTYSSANVWQYITINIPGPTTGGTTAFSQTNGTGVQIFWELGVGPGLSVSASGVWQSVNALGVTGATKINTLTGATYQVTGVQLEVGTTATSFDFRSIGTELNLCKRYYQNIIGIIGSGGAGSIFSNQEFPVEMRTAPTAGVTGPINFTSAGINNYVQSSANISVAGSSSTHQAFVIFGNFSGIGNSVPYLINVNSNYMTLSAEL